MSSFRYVGPGDVRPSGNLVALANLTVSGAGTIVAAVGGKQIVVLGYRIFTDSAMTMTWSSSVAGAIGAAMPLPVGSLLAPWRSGSYFATVAGEALVLNLSAGGHVGVEVDYMLF